MTYSVLAQAHRQWWVTERLSTGLDERIGDGSMQRHNQSMNKHWIWKNPGHRRNSCVLIERMGLLGHDWGWRGNRGLEGVLCRRGGWEEMKVMGSEWVGRVLMIWWAWGAWKQQIKCFERFIVAALPNNVEELRYLIVTEWQHEYFSLWYHTCPWMLWEDIPFWDWACLNLNSRSENHLQERCGEDYWVIHYRSLSWWV